MLQRRFKLMAIMLALAACRPEHVPATHDRWWTATCGELQPLGVMGGHDVVPPILVERVEPRWPRQKTPGVIIVDLVLTAEGRVCAARIARGLGELTNLAALDAVKQWRFTPARLDGRPRAAFYAVAVPVH